MTLEAQKLTDLLYGAAGVGPTLSTDSKALFHVDHGNLGSGAIGVSGLNSARLALRTMKGLDGTTIIQVAPRYLVVPAALETTGEQALTSISAAQVSNANPFSGTLEIVVVPHLDAHSAANW